MPMTEGSETITLLVDIRGPLRERTNDGVFPPSPAISDHQISIAMLAQVSLALLGFGLVNAQSAPASDLEILVGQHVIYSFATPTPSELLMNLTSAGLVGGVILFTENIDSATAANMEALQAAYASSPAPAVLEAATGYSGPLLIMTDQEGGAVKRIEDGGPYRSAKEVGAAANPEAAGRTTGNAAAETLNRYANNVNLAPVMDVYREEGDFLDNYERSYGNTTAMVTDAAVPFLVAQQEGGVAGTAKHFPGLGSAPTDANTDLEPVTLDLPLSELRDVDEAAFAAAIAAGVDLVMMSWADYTALDAGVPAGLSREWVTAELRERLGYNGVIITDAIEAGSLGAFGDLGERSIKAKGAGVDVILTSFRDETDGDAIRQAMLTALEGGALSRDELDASSRRIAELRAKLA